MGENTLKYKDEEFIKVDSSIKLETGYRVVVTRNMMAISQINEKTEVITATIVGVDTNERLYEIIPDKDQYGQSSILVRSKNNIIAYNKCLLDKKNFTSILKTPSYLQDVAVYLYGTDLIVMGSVIDVKEIENKYVIELWFPYRITGSPTHSRLVTTVERTKEQIFTPVFDIPFAYLQKSRALEIAAVRHKEKENLSNGLTEKYKDIFNAMDKNAPTSNVVVGAVAAPPAMMGSEDKNKFHCVACNDTGKNSYGYNCYICNRDGKGTHVTIENKKKETELTEYDKTY